MRNPRFDGIRERLLQGGVAPRHVRRTLQELEDHFTDLLTELQAAGHSRAESESQAATRLGSDDVFVASVLARPELRSKARRWPWLAFGALPFIAFIALFIASVELMTAVFEFAEHHLGLMPANSPALYWARAILQTNAMWLAPLFAAGLGCFVAARRRAPIAWPLAATLIIGLLGAMTNISLEWSAASPKGYLSGGWGFSTNNMLIPGVRAIVTIAVVLIPYFWWRRATLTTPSTP